jgi:hypothetical protein
VTLTFLLVLVDTAIDCSPRASLNFVEFIWHNIKTLAFIKYAIVCTPLETPKILFLRHSRDASDGWRTFNPCTACCRDCRPSIQRFMNECSFPRSYSDYPNSCKCNLCLRQRPNLRDLASHSVLHLTFNLSEFQLNPKTVYHYLHSTNSHLVPEDKLIPYTGICLQAAYAHPTLSEHGNRFHEYYNPDCYVFWRSHPCDATHFIVSPYYSVTELHGC